MKLGNGAEQFLYDVSKPGQGRVFDDTDCKLGSIIGDWRQMGSIDVGLLGVPFDGGSNGPQGQKNGPDAIRGCLRGYNTYEAGLDVDVRDMKLADFGNVAVRQNEIPESHRRIELVLTEIIRNGVIPLVFGGDHGLSYPTAKALFNAVDGKVGVINFDSHLDFRKIHDGFISCGTPFRRLKEENDRNPLDLHNFVEIGMNGWQSQKEYRDEIIHGGGSIYSARDVHKRGIETVMEQALAQAADGTDAIWISFDIDGIDSASVVGTQCPNPGGLTAAEALEAVWMGAQHPKVRGMDIMEVLPDYDVRGATTLMASFLASQFIGGVAKRIYDL